MTVPPADAPFSDKMAYYKTQHTSRGTRFTHMLGTPVIAAAIPLLVAKPRVRRTLARRSQRKAARKRAVKVLA